MPRNIVIPSYAYVFTDDPLMGRENVLESHVISQPGQPPKRLEHNLQFGLPSSRCMLLSVKNFRPPGKKDSTQEEVTHLAFVALKGLVRQICGPPWVIYRHLRNAWVGGMTRGWQRVIDPSCREGHGTGKIVASMPRLT